MYPCNSVNSPGRSRDTKSIREQTGRIQGTVVSLIRNPGRSRTPSQFEPQILALMVRVSPKLVRQMSSALTKLRVNLMSVDIGITEG
ncbi:hypothetical protein Prudu_021898, partial [Prunus dulcis]